MYHGTLPNPYHSFSFRCTLDPNKQNENIEFVSSQSPKKRLDPASSAGRSECQKHLDALAGVFIDRVARNMKVSRTTVLNDFGRGGVLMGKAAVKNKMAHKLGSFEGVIKQLGHFCPSPEMV